MWYSLPVTHPITDLTRTGCVSESGDFFETLFSYSTTLGRLLLSPFCCQLFKAFCLQWSYGLEHSVLWL
jgi:hypothetical protein